MTGMKRLLIIFPILLLTLIACAGGQMNEEGGVSQLVYITSGGCVTSVGISEQAVTFFEGSWSYTDLRRGNQRSSGEFHHQNATAQEIEVYTTASTDREASQNLLNFILTDGPVMSTSIDCEMRGQ